MRSVLRSWFWISLPLLVLAIDLLSFPFYESPSLGRGVTLAQVLLKQRATVGTIKGHQIDVGLDSVARSGYLSHLRSRRPNALVISTFIGTDKRVGLGAFGRAIESKLQKVSPADAQRLRDLVATSGAAAGTVRDLPLTLSAEQRERFPIDHLFVVVLLSGNGVANEQAQVLDRALGRLLRRAAVLRVDTLVLPILGHNWRDSQSLTFEYFYDTLFAALGPPSAPRRIEIGLYVDWPTQVLHEAVAQLRTSTNQLYFDDPSPRLHRGTWRSLLLFLAVCLVVCARRMKLTFTSTVAIAVAFTGFVLAIAPVIDLATAGMSIWPSAAVHVLVYTIIAVAFPTIVRATAESMFAAEARP